MYSAKYANIQGFNFWIAQKTDLKLYVFHYYFPLSIRYFFFFSLFRKNRDGQTALTLAALNAHEDLAHMLLGRGAQFEHVSDAFVFFLSSLLSFA
jgi:ankyrin repeat protein